MKLAIRMPNATHAPTLIQSWEPQLTPSDILDIVGHADRLGFDMVTIPEHFFVPASQLEHTKPHYFHVFTAMGFLAGGTERIRMTSGANILPLQNALATAKGLATADWMSNGRVQMIHGVGWLEDEFAAMGVPFKERGRICDEYLAAIIELFTKDLATFEGQYISFRDVAFEPKPVQKPYPPIWLAGDAEAVLRRIARFGNGWNPWLTKPEELPAKLDYIRSQPTYDGRPLEIYLAPVLLQLGARHHVQDDERSQGTRDVQLMVDLYADLWEKGVTMTMVPVPPVADRQAYCDYLQWIIEEIRPRLPA